MKNLMNLDVSCFSFHPSLMRTKNFSGASEVEVRLIIIIMS
jgi:hypothetical protein